LQPVSARISGTPCLLFHIIVKLQKKKGGMSLFEPCASKFKTHPCQPISNLSPPFYFPSDKNLYNSLCILSAGIKQLAIPLTLRFSAIIFSLGGLNHIYIKSGAFAAERVRRFVVCQGWGCFWSFDDHSFCSDC
jgi:hypothetical protein